MLEANKKYASEQGPRNYQAEINSLKRDTLENYYKLKELENQVAIAKDNVALKEKLLANTQLKYKLGTVSKNDVLKAETAVYEAKDGLLAAENGLNAMKMGFNIFMGLTIETLPDRYHQGNPLSQRA
jgi:outer membrane protein TolC